MASVIDVSALTINAEEERDIAAAIFEIAITGGGIAESHEIETGISYRQQIVFVGLIGLVGKAITGCSFPAHDNSLALTQKFWDPVQVGGRLSHCARDLNNLQKLFRRATNVNPDFYDKIDSPELGLVTAAIETALLQMLHRLIWFGDKNAALVANSGVITAGTDLGFFTPIDGLFKQLFNDITTSADNYVAIAENQNASYAAQALTGTDRGMAILRAMYNARSKQMRQAMSQGLVPVFYVTADIYDDYANTLEDKSFNFTNNEARDGVNNQRYRGIEIVVRNDWDIIIQTYQDNGTKYNLPHRALLTFRSNIPVGTLATSDLETVSSFYDRKDLTNYMDFAMYLDTKHLVPELSVFAY